MKLYLEVSALQEMHFTGIASVVALLAAEMLGDESVEAQFFYYRQMIPRSVIETVLRQRDGRQLEWLASNCAFSPVAPPPDERNTVGLYPNVKTARYLFAFEAQIIHDLSFLVTPCFHLDSVVQFHQKRFLADIVTNDLNICVSEATAGDLLGYFPELSPASVFVMPLGPALPLNGDKPESDISELPVEPYVLVLGTLEPRKNIDAVLGFLKDHPRILDHFRFVFTGRDGWGESFHGKLERFGLQGALSEGRILLTGFVSEMQKQALMARARLVLYPSVFEGFGLPVLEALALGTPVITTAGTSLPAISGEDGFYFDPADPKGLATLFFGCLAQLEDNEDQVRQSCRQRAQEFLWSKSYQRLKNRIAAGLDRSSSLSSGEPLLFSALDNPNHLPSPCSNQHDG